LISFSRHCLCALAFTLLLACTDSDQALVDQAPQAVVVQTTRIQPASWSHNFKSYGLVTPAEEFEITVEVSATVREVLFKAGDSVEAGDVLLRLDDKKLKFRLDGTAASVEEARANYEQARSTHKRNKPIYDSGVISEQIYLQSEARLKSGKANLSRAIASHDIALEELADAEVESPVTGVVTRRNVESGQNVSPIDRLGVIRVQDALRVETFVSQKDVNHIDEGMLASITSPGVPGQTFWGRVDQVASSAEPSTGNFEVGVVAEDADGLLRDGMSAMVEFTGTPQQGVLGLPRTALVDRGRQLIVYRVENDKAQAVELTLGVGNSELVPVFSGLDSGDEIVISNLRLISDGQLIRRATIDSEN
jgi:membrane fusion protein (multidrug efflux system)